MVSIYLPEMSGTMESRLNVSFLIRMRNDAKDSIDMLQYLIAQSKDIKWELVGISGFKESDCLTTLTKLKQSVEIANSALAKLPPGADYKLTPDDYIVLLTAYAQKIKVLEPKQSAAAKRSG